MVERKQCFQSFRDSLNALEWLTTSHSYLTSCGMCKIFLLITLNCNYWSKLFISYSSYSFFLNMLWTWSSIGTNLQNLKLLQTSLPPPLPPPSPPFEIHFRHCRCSCLEHLMMDFCLLSPFSIAVKTFYADTDV